VIRVAGVSIVRRWAVSIGIVFAVLAADPARSGTVVELKTVYFAENRPEETATIYLDEGRVRFDAVEDGRPTTLIFRRGRDGEPLCWVIDKETRAYIEFTDKNAQALRAEGARAEFKEIASGVKFNRWTCTQYEAYVQGEKQEDLWAAAEKDVGLDAPQIAALREMGDFFSRISTETNAFFEVGRSANEGGFRGFPVLVVEYRDGRKQERSEVTSVRRESLESSVFELPPGARRQKLMSQP
jgi:hypothetical protein